MYQMKYDSMNWHKSKGHVVYLLRIWNVYELINTHWYPSSISFIYQQIKTHWWEICLYSVQTSLYTYNMAVALVFAVKKIDKQFWLSQIMEKYIWNTIHHFLLVALVFKETMKRYTHISKQYQSNNIFNRNLFKEAQ